MRATRAKVKLRDLRTLPYAGVNLHRSITNRRQSAPMRFSLQQPAAMVLLHAAICLSGAAAMALAPPASGAMLLVPLIGDPGVVRIARASGALLVGTGPAGSVVIRGERGLLFWRMLRAGVLPIAAPAAYCGKGL